MRLLLLATLALCAGAQNDAPLAFEAASVKVNTSGSGDSHSQTRPANVQFVLVQPEMERGRSPVREYSANLSGEVTPAKRNGGLG